MAKLLSHKSGFTLVELLLVLTIVALTIFLTVSYHKRLIQPMDLETQTTLLTSKIDYYQSLAIKKKTCIISV
ncbi:prepilin-type N-terminal cleavage/methylation domain-containing protein [Staphylococcus ratti]|uniref:prepilin-type N-terminal cleavage/methylation domain-containing protein n=1 Tax=Staphylococcus ratti TaxID=2892440 RepID=UPI003B847D4B